MKLLLDSLTMGDEGAQAFALALVRTVAVDLGKVVAHLSDEIEDGHVDPSELELYDRAKRAAADLEWLAVRWYTRPAAVR